LLLEYRASRPCVRTRSDDVSPPLLPQRPAHRGLPSPIPSRRAPRQSAVCLRRRWGNSAQRDTLVLVIPHRRRRNGRRATDSQIELLCEIEEHDPTTLTGDKGRDLERLLSGGYVKPMMSSPGPAFRLTSKGNAFLAERGAGLNEDSKLDRSRGRQRRVHERRSAVGKVEKG
jgi:hypothetical protein